MKRKGWLELHPHLEGHGGWRLTAEGSRRPQIATTGPE
jgi:hypothetical protein